MRYLWRKQHANLLPYSFCVDFKAQNPTCFHYNKQAKTVAKLRKDIADMKMALVSLLDSNGVLPVRQIHWLVNRSPGLGLTAEVASMQRETSYTLLISQFAFVYLN